MPSTFFEAVIFCTYCLHHIRFGSLIDRFLPTFCHILYIAQQGFGNITAIFLKIHKSIADVEGGQALYNKYSEVTEKDGGWLSLRETVLAREMPRRMLVQPLTVMGGGEE